MVFGELKRVVVSQSVVIGIVLMGFMAIVSIVIIFSDLQTMRIVLLMYIL